MGAFTAYIDLNLMALTALCLPLIYVLLEKPSWRNAMDLSAHWGIAFFGLWFAKWVLASVICRQNAFTDALYQAKHHTAIASNPEPLRRIHLMLDFTARGVDLRIVALLLAALALFVCFGLWRKRLRLRDLLSVYPFAVPMVLPYAYMQVLAVAYRISPVGYYRSLFPVAVAFLFVSQIIVTKYRTSVPASAADSPAAPASAH